MTTSPNSRPGGAVPVGGPPSRRKWLLPLLLALVALIALILLLSRCGNDDDDPTSAPVPAVTTTPAATAGTSAAAPSISADAGGAGEPGSVTAGGETLLGTGDTADIAGHDGDEAVGRGVVVQSVPADEGFWVGTSADDRLWVQLSGTRGESDYRVKQGDAIAFTGTVRPAAEDFAAEVGLTTEEGAAQLAEQAYYISVPSSSVKLFEK